MVKGYTTKTKIENYLMKSIDVTFESQIDSWIEGVERTIDKITQRNFKADTVASERLYDGDDTNDLLIDDCVEVTKVEVGLDSYGVAFQEVIATGANRYFKYPANYGALGFPVSKISLSAQVFPCGQQNNKITAKWGYSVAVPLDIEFVATVFVAGIVNQSMPGGDQIKSEKIGNFQVTYNTEDHNNSWADFERAKDILREYTKLNI